MIVLFTDFGAVGPYTGQLKAVLHRDAPGVDVVDLIADAPAHEPKAAAYLLAALVGEFPAQTVFLCVVDPGVGGARAPGVLRAEGRWFVGPDNGLLAVVARRGAPTAEWWEITWRPERLSPTFHGRDLFAPVAARLARGEPPVGEARPAAAIERRDWPEDLAEVVYVDSFGNAITGLRVATLPEGATVAVGERTLPRAEKFVDVSEGEPFWYENSNGLVEIAANRARAVEVLALAVGAPVTVAKM